MTTLRPIALATAAAVVLSGCALPFAGDDDSTSPPSSSTSASSSTADPTPTADIGRAGRQLTEKEVKEALPDAPKGYTASDQATSSHRRADPEICLDVLLLGWQGRNAQRKRTARVNDGWHKNGDKVETYHAQAATIATHSEPVSPHLLGRAGEALGQCESFSLTGQTSGASFDDRVLAEGLQVRNIGEQTFAVRLITFTQINGRTHRLYVDTLNVRAGHNTISVQSVSYREDQGTDELEEMAGSILDDLRK